VNAYAGFYFCHQMVEKSLFLSSTQQSLKLSTMIFDSPIISHVTYGIVYGSLKKLVPKTQTIFLLALVF